MLKVNLCTETINADLTKIESCQLSLKEGNAQNI